MIQLFIYLKEIVENFFKCERRIIFKRSEDSYSIKYGHPAFLFVSLFFGISSATRDCPKIYHDNGSFFGILTSPQQCVWPIIKNIINGINILYRCYKLWAWFARRKEEHQANGSQHTPTASPIHEQGQGSIPSSSTPRDSRFSSQGFEQPEMSNATTHHEQASVTNRSPRLNDSNPEQAGVPGHFNGPEEVSEPRSSQSSYNPSLGSVAEDWRQYQLRRVSTGR